jgi:hypothetical protein
VALFTWLTRKDQPFFGGIEANNVFQSLKAFFMTVTLLIHVDPSKLFVFETAVFDFAIGVVLSQLGKYNLLHHVDFYSCKFSFMEIIDKIHDKELLAIVDAFEEWHHLLKGAQHEITVYSYHKNL